MRRYLCAPDSFKGSLSAPAAGAAMASGIRASFPDAVIDECPVADGGEGTVEALVRATAGEFRTTRVTDPLGRPIDATWGLLGKQEVPTAVIEMAAASGLTLLEAGERDPTRTSSFGTGQLMLAAAEAGAQRVLLGLGGSATTDGGGGAAMALGVRFFDAAGAPLDSFTGADLERVQRIETSGRRFANLQIVICRDVDNLLTGPDGAAAVYGPQKGATPTQVTQLDHGLDHIAGIWAEQLGIEVRSEVGAGAAGGMGGGITAMLGAETRSGIETVLDVVGFRQRVRGAILCLTGEGQLDSQSLSGKACVGVAKAAQAEGVETVAIVGSLRLDDDSALREFGMRAIELAPGVSTEESMQGAAELLSERAAKAVRNLD
ncbi:MAG: glycerate kinase [Planctomycetota bacterium]|nr:glycerate kinase [Planctomycetota bacterium]